MFDNFELSFPRDPSKRVDETVGFAVPGIAGLQELLSSLGGSSFAGGLYRVVHPKDMEVWNLRVMHAFPEFEKRIVCFGFDWLGSVFALDSARLEEGQPAVVMFEPGTGKSLEIPSNILTFHNSGLMTFGEAALAISFFHKWLAGGGQRPSIAQCVGYKKPLFLGGKDVIENLELSDIDVYWRIMGQLIRKARGLPEGTPVRIGIG